MKLLIATVLLSSMTFAENFTVVQGGKEFLGDLSRDDVAKLKKPNGRFIKSKVKKQALKEIKIKEGDSVTFFNYDRVSHNLSNKEMKVNIKQPKFEDKGYKVDFKKKGEYEIKCKVHPKMKILVKVD
jgi:plastocyanin